MRDRSTLGAAGLVVAALALASLAAQPRPPAAASAPESVSRHPRAAEATPGSAARLAPGAPAQAEHVGVLRDGGRLDLNLATARDLELLPGIGPALARRIIDDRARGGAYRSADDLVRVSGIGPAKLERIRALVRVDAHQRDAATPVQRSNKNTPDTSAVR